MKIIYQFSMNVISELIKLHPCSTDMLPVVDIIKYYLHIINVLHCFKYCYNSYFYLTLVLF